MINKQKQKTTDKSDKVVRLRPFDKLKKSASEVRKSPLTPTITEIILVSFEFGDALDKEDFFIMNCKRCLF